MNQNPSDITRRDFLRACAATLVAAAFASPRSFAQSRRSGARPSPARVPIEAEKCVLSCLLIAPELIERAGRELTTEHFAVPQHALIFGAMLKIQRSGQACDFIAVTQKLHDDGEFENAGGAAGLADIFTYVASGANYSLYAAVLKEEASQ